MILPYYSSLAKEDSFNLKEHLSNNVLGTSCLILFFILNDQIKKFATI
jgi:hypothetical protein